METIYITGTTVTYIMSTESKLGHPFRRPKASSQRDWEYHVCPCVLLVILLDLRKEPYDRVDTAAALPIVSA